VQASLITFSQTGNTLKVSSAIGEVLAREGFVVDALRFRHRRKWKPEPADLVGIGCPVFENRPAEVVMDFLATAELDLTGKQAFVFITSGGSPARSLWHLGEAVRARGAELLGGVQVRGTSTYPTLAGLFPGRPNSADLTRARDFAHAVAAATSRGAAMPYEYRLDRHRGGRFYDTIGPAMSLAKKKLIPLPTAAPHKCDLCGRCVKECPAKTIKMRHGAVQFGQGCIRCYRCWHVCPSMAIDMKMSAGGGLFERLVYGERMERLFGNVEPGESQGENRSRDVIARRLRLKYSEDEPTSELE
jgi:Fe-S-cluster-containing hydrogenase component 2/flavodoxin